DSIYRARDPYKHKLALFQLLAHLYEKKGNMSLAYIYSDSALMIKDTMAVRLSAIALARNEQKIATEKYYAELENANTQKQLQQLIRNGLIVVIILLGIIGVL